MSDPIQHREEVLYNYYMKDLTHKKTNQAVHNLMMNSDTDINDSFHQSTREEQRKAVQKRLSEVSKNISGGGCRKG